MHLKGVCHAALSVDSVYLEERGSLEPLLLGSFDRSRRLSPGELFMPSLSGDVNGLPPEAFGSAPVDGVKLDAWSLGVLYFCLVCGRFPFGGKTLADGAAAPSQVRLCPAWICLS